MLASQDANMLMFGRYYLYHVHHVGSVFLHANRSKFLHQLHWCA